MNPVDKFIEVIQKQIALLDEDAELRPEEVRLHLLAVNNALLALAYLVADLSDRG